MPDAHDIIQEKRDTHRDEDRPSAYYTLLIVLYNILFGGFLVAYKQSKRPLETLSSLDLMMLGLATLRVSKVISEDEITSVLRRPVVIEHDGLREPERRSAARIALGKLVLCPTCTGTWVAAFLTYGLHLFPRYTRPFLAIMSASGISQFSDAVLSLVYTDRDVLRKHE